MTFDDFDDMRSASQLLRDAGEWWLITEETGEKLEKFRELIRWFNSGPTWPHNATQNSCKIHAFLIGWQFLRWPADSLWPSMNIIWNRSNLTWSVPRLESHSLMGHSSRHSSSASVRATRLDVWNCGEFDISMPLHCFLGRNERNMRNRETCSKGKVSCQHLPTSRI